MNLRRTALTVLAASALLAGCANVVDGTGAVGGSASAAPGGGSGPTDFPSASASGSLPSAPSGPSQSAPVVPSATAAPAGVTDCPHASYPAAKLRFDCLPGNFVPFPGDELWPMQEILTVEPATGWVAEEGAARWGPSDGESLAAITTLVRTRMITNGSYLPSPTVTTVSSKNATVGGVPAHILQSTMTLNPAQAKKRGTKVRAEHLWIIALQVSSGEVSLWHTSIPDLAKSLWPKVPAIINTIRVE